MTMSNDDLARIVLDLKKQVDDMGRSRQQDMLPDVIKQRNIDGTIMFSGLAADIPDGSSHVKEYFATDTNTLYIWNGDRWITHANQIIAYKTADETVNNSDTLQDDDELTFEVEANATYSFQFVLFFNSGTTPDYKFGWTYPTGTTLKWGDFFGGTGIETTVSNINGTGSNAVMLTVGTIFVGSTEGSMTIQWAQRVANASDTKTLAGTSIIATRVA